MSRIRFTDGVELDTSGKYRIIRLDDGLYVTGHGMLIAVGSDGEGQELIAKLKLINCDKQ